MEILLFLQGKSPATQTRTIARTRNKLESQDKQESINEIYPSVFRSPICFDSVANPNVLLLLELQRLLSNINNKYIHIFYNAHRDTECKYNV